MTKARILAVDDQRYFRELIEGLLDGAGYSVTTCGSGEAALQHLEREDYDVIISDLVMPELDGAELVRRVKERRPDQPIVVVTGVVDVETAVSTMRLGATDYLLKPFDRETLVGAVERILAERRLVDEHARLVEENLAFMGVLSLVERASGLFSTLAVEPLAERIVEGLCLETRAQSGVLWTAVDPGSARLELVGARGLVRVEGEPEFVELDEIESAWAPGLGDARSVLASLPEDLESVEALYLPLRSGETTLGVVRLSDKLDGEAFRDEDRRTAEKFGEFCGSALSNALRFRALERRSLRDPETRAYSPAFLADAVRNEVQKAQRFGQRFSLLRVEVDGRPTPGGEGATPLDDRERVEVARRLEGALRATDLMASGEEDAFTMLLPQTDALGAGILAQRVRDAFGALWSEGDAPSVHFAAATFPTDGLRVEALETALEARLSAARESPLLESVRRAGTGSVDAVFDRLVAQGTALPPETEGQLLRFVVEDVVRRPDERGVLFVSPGVRWLPAVLEALEELRAQSLGTEIVLLSEGELGAAHAHVTRVPKSAIDSRRPFVVYFGEGPAYAMVGAVPVHGADAACFQTADRALVEFLSFELQQALDVRLAA